MRFSDIVNINLQAVLLRAFHNDVLNAELWLNTINPFYDANSPASLVEMGLDDLLIDDLINYL